MTVRIAINGFGRIGRNVLRALYEGEHRDNLQVVAINDLGDARTNAHLLKYDTVHGQFNANVSHDDDSMSVNDDQISLSQIRNPAELPWGDLDIDVVFECTGLFPAAIKPKLISMPALRKSLFLRQVKIWMPPSYLVLTMTA